MNQLEPDEAGWVRDKIAERGMTEEIEAEARRRVNVPHDPMGDFAVRALTAAGLFLVFYISLAGFGLPWWTYLIAAAVSILISK